MIGIGIELGFAFLVAGVAAVQDVRTRTLPDALAIGTAVVGLGTHAVFGGLAGVGESVLGAVACAVLPAMFVARGGLGRGDLKLFAALGMVLGPMLGLEVQLYAFVAAALAAPVVAWRRGTLRSLVRWKEKGSTWMPFAPAMVVGVLGAALGLAAR